MAIGKKTGGRNFIKGESGNPGGRPALPEDIREARALNRVEFTRILNTYLYLSENDLKARAASNISAIELIVAKVILAAIKVGDYKRLEFFLEQTLGREESRRAEPTLTERVRNPKFMDELLSVPGFGHSVMLRLINSDSGR
ncbi:MAG: DUF5681 domain-containing protein [Pseudomonadota bacterium]|nr:DUF5681 domain-containing protein [Pseudomonadota bacterium]